MNEPEAFQLLTLASARDGRTVSQSVAKVWADDLVDIPLRDAVTAARMHYREFDKWLMPSHIIQGVRRVRRDREREAARLRPLPTGNVITFDREKFDRETAAAIEQARREKQGEAVRRIWPES